MIWRGLDCFWINMEVLSDQGRLEGAFFELLFFFYLLA